eukprot:CAMPEP_0202866160 /NCGR_PEP_ID=MMETSP1391-20130828/7235_1 /ASSEMBLY_ACC=CAM_ASM_000867 /TAXON_ID=1034604 /ORGANISM="Chlamydomonas leiostraca, Strain SAG 11-49" /LENGTH=52 /DNA_ID=CAMNT_0049546083 /DNA_START=197 /DNA_END=351 /DNA_ORIENTATION=+
MASWVVRGGGVVIARRPAALCSASAGGVVELRLCCPELKTVSAQLHQGTWAG